MHQHSDRVSLELIGKSTSMKEAVRGLSYYLSLKAETLHLADRTPEAIEAINEAKRLAERFENRVSCVNLHRLRGVFLATMGADETQIEASFCAALRIAREQKSISLVKTAEAKADQNSPHTIGTAGNEIWETGDWTVILQAQNGPPVQLQGRDAFVDIREGDTWKDRMQIATVAQAPDATSSVTTTPSNK